MDMMITSISMINGFKPMLNPALEKKIAAFLAKYPNHVKIVQNVPFKKKEESTKNTALRPVLAISSFGLSALQKEALLTDYREFITGLFISFSVWEKSTHLFLQKDGRFFDFGFWVIPYWPGKELKTKFYRFRERKIRFPNSRRLEPLIEISESEKSNLAIYLANMAKGYKKMLGKYYDPGNQQSNAKLDDNRSAIGHNCTSWITTAPIGANGECLIELLGSDRSHQIGTNPGWWISWMLYATSAQRIPLVLYWSPDPMAEILANQVREDKSITWDFNKL